MWQFQEWTIRVSKNKNEIEEVRKLEVKAKPSQNGRCEQVKKSSGSDEDTKMINKLRKDKNRGSRVRIVEAMFENHEKKR